MDRITLDDGSTWPNPDTFDDLAWTLRHNRKVLTDYDYMNAAEIINAYNDLITHFTLEVVKRKIRDIRKGMK